ncbi:hypothetical protein BM221_008544 [Beauveria bassiana]|uniref:Uncharacterized protein n=1 Tax=Beauveria bassiana TaxID=176275 RepID=A0A2N6ND38_BEABA|nr:hypothetical protein BM221_008544 [Beauveria bassiana]
MTRTTDLGVLIERYELLIAGGQAESDGLVAGKKTIDTTIWTDLIPAFTFLNIQAIIDELDGILILRGNRGWNLHNIATVVLFGAGVSDVGYLGESRAF